MDIFVSYSSKDEALAQELCEMLARGGYQHWIATDHAAHGKPYASAIIEAIDQAPAMLLVLSQTAADSPHVLNEVNYAFGHGKPILPVVAGQLTLPKELEYYLGAQNLLPYAPTEEFEQELLAMVAEAVNTGPREQRPTVVAGAEYEPQGEEPEAIENDEATDPQTDDQEEYSPEPKGALALVLTMWGLAIVALVVMVLLILSPGGKDDSKDKDSATTTTTTTTTTAESADETTSTTPVATNPTWGNTTRPSTTATTGKTGSTSKTTGKTGTTATTGSTTASTTESTTTTTTSAETTTDTTTTTEAPTESTEAPTDTTTSTEATTEATTQGTEATSNDSAE